MNYGDLPIPPSSAPYFSPQSEFTSNDACPTCGQPIQLAMEQKSNPYEQVVGGRMRGGEGGAGGRAQPEILSPKSASQEPASIQNQIKELEDQQRSLMQLGPMVPTLVRLGVTPAEMTKMNPAQAIQFIKSRSPQGMGQRDMDAERMVQETIDRLRDQRGILSGQLK